MVEEELGQRITEKSSKISYFILLAAVGADQWVNGTVNVFLLAALALGMVTLPLVEFLVARKYQ